MDEIDHQEDVAIITSLRWTVVGSELAGKYQDLAQEDIDLLPLHRDRMSAAAKELAYEKLVARLSTGRILSRLKFDLENSAPKLEDTINVYKARLAFTADGEYQIGCSSILSSLPEAYQPTLMIPTPEMTLPKSITCQVFIDTKSHRPTAFTRHKTSVRKTYDDARSRAGISTAPLTEAEVLLVNNEGQVMEASLCTPYFYRDGKWITPHADCGGNQGVTRRLALETGFAVQGIIEKKDLKDGELIWLSNAVRGFFGGQIKL